MGVLTWEFNLHWVRKYSFCSFTSIKGIKEIISSFSPALTIGHYLVIGEAGYAAPDAWNSILVIDFRDSHRCGSISRAHIDH